MFNTTFPLQNALFKKSFQIEITNGIIIPVTEKYILCNVWKIKQNKTAECTPKNVSHFVTLYIMLT